jgi:broad specificity phosphatase PhoE
MFFALRHGERADHGSEHEISKIEHEHDPHLTDLGKIQAKKAGEKIFNLINTYYKESPSKVNDLQYLIISSPFRRCIETAYYMSESLPKEKIIGQTIYLNDFLCDYLHYLPEDILKTLQSKTDLEYVKNHVSLDLQDGYPAPGDHAYAPQHPEGVTDIKKRVSEGFEKIKEHYLNSVNKESNVVLIMVTHGFVVECLLDIHDGFEKAKGLQYTTLSHVVYDPEDGKGKVLVGQDHEHLQEAEEEYKVLLSSAAENVIRENF